MSIPVFLEGYSSAVCKFYPLKIENEWTYLIGGEVCNQGESVNFKVVDVSEQLGSCQYVLEMSGRDEFKPLILLETREGLSEEGTDIYLLNPPFSRGRSWVTTRSDRHGHDKALTVQILDTDGAVHLGDNTFTGCLVTLMIDEAHQRTEQVTYAPGIGPVLYLSEIGTPAVKSTLTITSWKVQEVA